MENNPKKCVLKRISMSFILAFLMIFNFHTFTIKAETNPGVQVINNCESQLVLSSGHYTITQDTTVSQGIVIHKGNIVYIEIPE